MSERPIETHDSGAHIAPKSQRYSRPRRLFSWWGLLFGLGIGLAAGLFYAWNIAPVQEFDTAPHQLRAEDKANYAVAVMLSYAYDSDLNEAINRLSALDLGLDPIQAVADIACDLARTGYVDSSAGIRAIRSMRTFYQLQGRAGCADELVPDVSVVLEATVVVPTNTPTLPPPPTKTPTPDAPTPTEAGVVIVPTTPPRRDFEGRPNNTFCDVELSGLIEVFVYDFDGEGLPGEQVRARWDDGEDLFVTGLKPERGPAYADFEMEPGRAYTLDMPGLSDPIRPPLVADRCITENGQEAITSYRVVFRRTG